MNECDNQKLINALCDCSKRCTRCYDGIDGNQCCTCMNYYLDCTCKPLTPSQIENNEHPRNCIICNNQYDIFDVDLNMRCEKCCDNLSIFEESHK